jgi:hypothetical protein
MKASEIRELLKLLEQPGIISFAGDILTQRSSPRKLRRPPTLRHWLARAMQQWLYNIR